MNTRPHDSVGHPRDARLRTLARDLVADSPPASRADPLAWLSGLLRDALQLDAVWVAEVPGRVEQDPSLRVRAGSHREATGVRPALDALDTEAILAQESLVLAGPDAAVALPSGAAGGQVRAFGGHVLRDHDGEVLGFLVGWGSRAFADPDEARAALQLVAVRCAIELRNDRTQRTLRHLVEGTAGAGREGVALALVRHLARASGSRFAFLSERVDEDRDRILAWTDFDTPLEPVTFALRGTPGHAVYRQRATLFIPQDLLARFPEDDLARAHGVVSYLGIPLLEPGGEILGHLAVLDDRPMPARLLETPWPSLFAARACAELLRRRAERARRAAERRIAELQRRDGLSLLASGIAHDFNNYLTAILGNVSALQRLAVPEPWCESVLEIRRATERATELARRMLDVAGGRAAATGPLHLETLAEDMVALLRSSIPASTALATSFEPDLPPLVGDATQLRQILMNLVLNAGEALGEAGGTITVRAVRADPATEPTASPVVDARLLEVDHVLLQVVDDGPGIAPETLRTILARHDVAGHTGRGLGLLIVRTLVRAQAGALWIHSEPQRGTTFSIALPAAIAHPPSRTSRSGSGSGRRGLALLVEKDPAVRDVVRRMLERLGHGVHAAASVDELLQTADELPPPLALALVETSAEPRGGSSHALRRLRSRFPDLPVVLLSSFPVAEDGTDAGAPPVRHLPKPFELADLRALVEELTAQRA